MIPKNLNLFLWLAFVVFLAPALTADPGADSAPVIISQPQSQGVLLDSSAGFNLSILSPGTTAVQWQFNGSPIPGAVHHILGNGDDFFSLPSVQFTNAGNYRAIVTNAFGAATSAVAHLEVRLRGALEQWRQVRGFPRSLDFGSIAYGNGVFVGIASIGNGGSEALTSRDGVVWGPPISITSDASVGKVIYGNGRFVAFANSTFVSAPTAESRILTSTDGLSWRLQLSVSNIFLVDIASHDGTFVAVGTKYSADGSQKGLAMVGDGTNWNTTEFDQATSFSPVVYGNGEFVAFGSDFVHGGNFAAHSRDGQTWETTSSPLPNILRAVVYGNGLYAALISGGGEYAPDEGGQRHYVPRFSEIYTSTNAQDWSWRAGFTFDFLNAGAFANGRFVTVGEDDGGGFILSSVDGTNWITAASGISDELRTVTYGNGRFVALGEDGAVSTSVDGETWIANFHGVATGNNIAVAVGQNGVILTSTNASDWAEQKSGTTNDLGPILFAQNNFITAGNEGSILTSPDGTNWIGQTSVTTNELHGLAYGNGVFVAVGRKGTILTSTDGNLWTPRTSGTTSYLKSVAYGNGLFIAVGNISIFSGTVSDPQFTASILTSADGTAWEMRTLFNTINQIYCTDIAYGNGRFVLVSEAGISVSTNSSEWSLTRSSFSNLRAVTYAAGQFVVVGNGGAILTSSDGSTWFDEPTFSLPNLRAATFFNNTFVAVGNEGTIVQSTDLTAAGLRAQATPEGIKLSIAGQSNRPYVLRVSSDLKNWTDVLNYTSQASLINLIDGEAGAFQQRFYQIISK